MNVSVSKPLTNHTPRNTSHALINRHTRSPSPLKESKKNEEKKEHHDALGHVDEKLVLYVTISVR
jgi:hypothetical protein